MGMKTIDGDLNVTGGYQVNGSALATGTKLYKHNLGGSDPIQIISTISTAYPNSTSFPTDMQDIISGVITGTVTGILLFMEIYWNPGRTYGGISFTFLKSDGSVTTITRSSFTDTVTAL